MQLLCTFLATRLGGNTAFPGYPFKLGLYFIFSSS